MDPGLIAEAGTWSDPQNQQVVDYLRGHVQPMLSGGEPAIERARDSILAPFGTAGVSPAFVRQYAQAIARELEPATQAESVQVRVNAMILAGRLPDTSALNPVAVGLQDTDAGVRYLAAVALNRLIVGGQIEDEQRTKVIELVTRQLAAESSSFVAAPMFMVMLDAQAFDPLLAILNSRVGWHVGRAPAGFAPEAESLRRLYARLFVGDGTPDQMRQLGRASVRYLWLASRQLEAGNVSDPQSHVAIIRVAQSALISVREGLGSSEAAPPSVDGLVTQERWSDIGAIAERWGDLLKAPPVGLAPADLGITAPEPAAAAQAQ